MIKHSYFSTAALILATVSFPASAAEMNVPKDYKSIQAAIDAAQPGDTVLVDAGTYRENVRLKQRVTLKSAGDDAAGKLGLKRAEVTIIDGGGADAKGPAVVMAEGAVLDGFTVTRAGLFDQKEYDWHYATHGDLLPDEQGAVGINDFPALGVPGVTATVRFCIVRDNGRAGIGVTGENNKSHVFKNVVLRNMGGGIGIANGASPTIQANKCFNNLRGGIGNRMSSAFILNNESFDNVRAGIGIREGSTPIVRGNQCYRNRRAGIGVRMEGTNPIIEDNDCYENEMAGIGNRDGAAPIIRKNRCYRNKMAGIGSRDGAKGIIEGNECYENDMAGIGSRLGAYPTIRFNKCYKNKMAGIGSREYARPIIEDNDCYENEMAGIGSREGATPVIRNNRCYKNEMAGIGSRLGARPVIVENECFHNKMAGIGTREGAAPFISKNRCYKNEMAGIGSRDEARPVIVSNESFENLMAGIGVRTGSKALIIGNKCIENRLVAIGLPDGASAFIHGNELIRTEGGAPPIIALRGGANAVVSDNLIRGGGVAGILVQGTTHISNNRFEGKGPDKQGSAIWVPFGGSFNVKSTVVVSKNKCDGYRNLINANMSDITANDNTVTNFSGPAIIVKKPSAPPRAFGNIAFSDQAKDLVVSIEGLAKEAFDNKLQPADLFKGLSANPNLGPLFGDPAKPDDCERFQKVFGPTTVTDGPWKLIVLPGEKTVYKLYNTKLDPDEKTDFSTRVPHLTLRLKGLRERLEAAEFKKYIQVHEKGR